MPKKRKPSSSAHRVSITHPDRVLFPSAGFTKADLVRYYVAVAPFLLPHLKGRAVTLIRFPDGVGGESFYSKNAPDFTPSWIARSRVARKRGGRTEYLRLESAEALAWTANLSAIELHPFLHCVAKPATPTHVVFDLDPGEGEDLHACAEVAFLAKAVLDRLGLQAFPKVSGSKGLQVYVPVNTKTDYRATSAFARAVALLLEQQHPDRVVSRMEKVLRRGRVLIDWSQNNPSKTTVAVYSVRGKRTEPFVSMPVDWTELRRMKRIETLQFSPEKALKRLEKRNDLFAPVLTIEQSLPEAFSSVPDGAAEEALAPYRAKRDFSKTSEPTGRSAKTKGAPSIPAGGRFVIQKHEASRLHYDFRLEMDGTLRSWAVPKGVPTDLGIKHAAFAVEDHPLGYIDFEGTIPKGQYGGGTVMVWDFGSYELTGGSFAKGDLKLELRGKKLKGAWHLFKIRSEDGKDVWLIIKSGRAARAIGPRADDRSALTGRTMRAIASARDRVWESGR